MKAITKILGIAGTMCLLGAAGNDDLMGSSCPITHLLALGACGAACIAAAVLINLGRAK